MSDWLDLKTKAMELGINTRGMKRPEIEAALVPLMSEKDRQTVADAAHPHNGMRKKRVPLGTPSLKLDHPGRPGYVLHWFNDAKNRLHDAEMAGYTFVEDTIEGRATRVSRRVGVHEDQSPMFAFLMEIREEFFKEDQAGKMAVVDEIDAAITRPNQPNDGDGDEPGFYTPDEGTSMRLEK